MDDVVPVLLMGLGGLLLGGVISLGRAKRVGATIVVGVLAAVALAGAVLWWWPT